jgi:hypothetical protein
VVGGEEDEVRRTLWRCTTTTRSRADERGQVAPLLAVLVLGVALAAVVIVAALGGSAGDRAAARTAADAGALAGAVGGDAAARRAVAANGGELVALHRDGDVVEVRARVGGAEATSRAEPLRCGGAGRVRGCSHPPP